MQMVKQLAKFSHMPPLVYQFTCGGGKQVVGDLHLMFAVAHQNLLAYVLALNVQAFCTFMDRFYGLQRGYFARHLRSNSFQMFLTNTHLNESKIERNLVTARQAQCMASFICRNCVIIKGPWTRKFEFVILETDETATLW